MTDQPKNPQDNQNPAENDNPVDNPNIVPETDFGDFTLPPLEAKGEFSKMMEEMMENEVDPFSLEGLTETNEDLKFAIETLGPMVADAEKVNQKTSDDLDALKKKAADAIAEAEKETSAKTSATINGFVSELNGFLGGYEKALSAISATEREADAKFDKIVRGFELTFGKLQNVFNKFSPKTETAPVVDNAAEAVVDEQAAIPVDNAASVQTAAPTVESLTVENAALQKQHAELLQKYEKTQQSTAALYRQIKSAEGEIGASISAAKTRIEAEAKYAIMPIIKELLPAIDTFETGVAFVGKDESASPSSSKLLASLKDEFDSLRALFNKSGVEVIEPKPHDEFNENVHSAVMTVEMDGFAEGVVVELKQKGYKLQDRVIRTASVLTTSV